MTFWNSWPPRTWSAKKLLLWFFRFLAGLLASTFSVNSPSPSSSFKEEQAGRFPDDRGNFPQFLRAFVDDVGALLVLPSVRRNHQATTMMKRRDINKRGKEKEEEEATATNKEEDPSMDPCRRRAWFNKQERGKEAGKGAPYKLHKCLLQGLTGGKKKKRVLFGSIEDRRIE